MKKVYLALSVPNKKQEQQIFGTFPDAAENKDKFRVFKPKNTEYWPESEIQNALATITGDLERQGYTVEVVPISEYHSVLDRHKKQMKA
ncbi:hypothetical protein [Ktedonobacter racemifer]|uniref:hypothetical protein n=1 Tax=Ktedonobacter racemifer TaxID=363277 RepID=UPI0012FA3D4F|nr:hypothetical protein [Ktedonobacter racemifer]